MTGQKKKNQTNPTNVHIYSQHHAHTAARGSVFCVAWYLKQFIFHEEKTCE